MISRLLFSVAMTSCLISYAQDFPVNEEGRYEITKIIVNEDKSAEEAFELAETWLTNYFEKKEEGKIQSRDVSELRLESSPLLFIQVRSGGQKHWAGSVRYALSIEIQEGRVFVQLSDFYHESNRSQYGSGGRLENTVPECGAEELPDHIWQQIRAETLSYCQNLLENLELSFAE